MSQVRVGIIMGSRSDLDIMQEAGEVLNELKVPFEMSVVSAHRTPDRMFSYAKSAEERGLEVIIAGAGGSAHLPGMVASLTCLPVVGVPIKSRNSLDGWDSLLSIVQMPNGIPVATVAVNAAKNAGLLAAQILGSSDKELRDKLRSYKKALSDRVGDQIKQMEQDGYSQPELG